MHQQSLTSAASLLEKAWTDKSLASSVVKKVAKCHKSRIEYSNLKGPRTPIIGSQGPNTISLLVFGL